MRTICSIGGRTESAMCPIFHLRPSVVSMLSTIAMLTAVVAFQSPAMAGQVKTANWTVTFGQGKASAVHRRSKKRVAIFKNEKKGSSSTTYRLLSVVGDIVSFRVDWYSEGGAHPSYGTRFATLDLSTGKPARLDTLFGKRSVRRAILGDRVIQKALRGKSKKGNLKQLLDRADGGCKMSITAGALSAFAFHSVRRGGKVAVRIGLSHGCETQRGSFSQLGLLLETPTNLKSAVRLANKQGALMAKLAPKKKKK
jgi:hypothetical protein